MRRPLVLLLVLLGVAALAIALVRMQYVRTAQYRTRVAIRELLRPGHVPEYVKVDDDSTEQRMRRFYQQRRNRPAWLSADAPTGQARALVEVLKQSDREGLPAASYRIAEIEAAFAGLDGDAPLAKVEPAHLAEIDVLLTHSYLKYAYNVYRGRIHPRVLPHDWIARPRTLDYVAHLAAALDRERVKASLMELPPPHPEYERLRGSLARYREIAAGGGWPAVGPGRTLALGGRGARVAALRRRLAVSGDLPAAAAGGDAFDKTLDRAVRTFQTRAGLEADGKVGPREVAALDVPVERRIRQIELNLERWRWLPADLGERYVLVNVPEYMLYANEDGKNRWSMRVIVGDEYTPTPIFSDTLTTMVVNPVWNVPASIAIQEIAAAMDDDPDYLAHHHMRVFDAENKEVDPRKVHWSEAADGGTRDLTIRQDPGDENALGRLKFMCPNRFNVYLHDTPTDHLFGAEDRDFSHGCIRLERPLDMAEYLMRGSPDWSRERIEREIAKPEMEEQHVKLPEKVPVHILYWTAWTDERGVAHFRDDVYGIDAMLDRALARRPALREALGVGDAKRGKKKPA